MVSSPNHPGEERTPELVRGDGHNGSTAERHGSPGQEAGRLTVAAEGLSGDESPHSGTQVQEQDLHP